MRISIIMIAVMTAGLIMGALLAGCGGGSGDYADFKAILNEELRIMQGFKEALEKVDSADGMAAAINKFSGELKGLSVRFEEVEKKYPELAALSEDPTALKGELEKLEKLSDEMNKVIVQKAQYIVDPKVEKAFEEMSAVMNELEM